MHSYTKSELAEAAGVSMNTFRRWLSSDAEYQTLLRLYHIPVSAKVLPPPIVQYLSAHYCIDLP